MSASPAEDVLVRSADGTRLAAWYVPSGNEAAIVLLHGSGSTRDDLLDHAAMLAAARLGAFVKLVAHRSGNQS